MVDLRTVAILLSLSLAGCLELETEYVAVVGVGEARMFPSHAALSVTMEGEGKTAALAAAVLSERITNAREIAATFGLTDEDISSAYFDVDRRQIYLRRPDGSRYSEDGAFVATQTIRVVTDDVSKAGELLAALIEADAEEVSPPVYLIEDTGPLFEKARNLAIKDASQRAELYAQNAGKTLGTIQVIEEAGTDAQRLDFNLRDRFVEVYEQDESGGQLRPSIKLSSPQSDTIIVTGSRIFAKPEDIAVTISIYGKFDLQ